METMRLESMREVFGRDRKGAVELRMSLRGFVVGFLCLFSAIHAQAGSIPKELLGDWTFAISSGQAGWISLSEAEGETPTVAMLLDVGSIGPLKGVEFRDGKIHVPLKTIRKGKKGPIVKENRATLWVQDGGLHGEVVTSYPDGKAVVSLFEAKPIPPMPPAPDLSKVNFGDPIALCNGKDLSGWRPRRPEKINGWSVEDGLLVNSTPKTDFSATGAYANLRTEAVFGDFKLHIEFLIEKDRNSGIYVKGMYEAQVVDRDSRMQGLQGVGSIFNRVEASENAGFEGGKWQTYEITLVDRHITVMLNGVKVIDNQPVPGPTAGAMHTDPMTPGPIYLQGDHTAVKYRNIVLTPVE